MTYYDPTLYPGDIKDILRALNNPANTSNEEDLDLQDLSKRDLDGFLDITIDLLEATLDNIGHISKLAGNKKLNTKQYDLVRELLRKSIIISRYEIAKLQQTL